MQGTREHRLVDTQPDISSPWGRTHRHGGSQQNFPSCRSCSSSSRVRQSLYILIKFLSCIDSRRSWQILGFLDFKMSAQNGRDILANSMSIWKPAAKSSGSVLAQFVLHRIQPSELALAVQKVYLRGSGGGPA